MLEVSAGIIIADSKVLCFQKGKAKYPYLSFKYEFPDGKVEKGENPKDTLIRELKEEIDADFSGCNIERLCDTHTDYHDFSVLIHSFIIWTNEPHYKLSEHQNVKWMDVNDLDTLDWVQADIDIVKNIKEYFSNHQI